MYCIVTDSSTNLDYTLLQKYQITSVPFSYLMNEKEYFCSVNEPFDGRSYYSAMRGGMRVSTSQVTPQRYVDYMRPLLARGCDVLYVGMSSGISGSYQSAQIAATQLREEFPAQKLVLIDTLGASLGEGLLVLRAAEFRDAGVSLEQTAQTLLELRQEMCQVFTVDDLKYLRATGRLSNLKAAVASVLQIKPLLKGDEEGKIVCFAKLRGRKNSIAAMAAQYEAFVKEPQTQMIGIAHADCPEEAEALAQMLQKINPPKEILTVCYEPVTGAHVGPGTLALFFLGDPSFRSAKQ